MTRASVSQTLCSDDWTRDRAGESGMLSPGSVRRWLILLTAVGLVAGGATVVVWGTESGSRHEEVGRDRDHDADADGDRDADGDEDEDEAPAGYLDLKDSSGQSVTAAQIARAQRQAAAIPSGDNGAWAYTGPTNVGGRVVD